MPSFTDLIDTVDVPVLLADATDEILRASGVSPDESRAHIERIGRRRFQHSLPERVPAATIAMTPSAIAAIKVARQMRCHRAEAGGPDEEIEALAADIAHDLKEPLRTVSMYTQLLARKVVLDVEGKELAESVAAKNKNPSQRPVNLRQVPG